MLEILCCRDNEGNLIKNKLKKDIDTGRDF